MGMLGCRACVCLTALVLLGSPLSASGDPPDHRNPRLADSKSLTTNNPVLQASLNRLFARSAAWREAVDALAKTGRRAIVVTPDRVKVADPASGDAKPFDKGVLAEVQPLPLDDLRVDMVVVVVNLALLEKLHPQATMSEFEANLDRILAHEIYGHAVPYLLAGHRSGRCADPQFGQRASEACAIQRENEIRLELGLGRRTDYGLDGLAIARRF